MLPPCILPSCRYQLNVRPPPPGGGVVDHECLAAKWQVKRRIIIHALPGHHHLNLIGPESSHGRRTLPRGWRISVYSMRSLVLTPSHQGQPTELRHREQGPACGRASSRRLEVQQARKRPKSRRPAPLEEHAQWTLPQGDNLMGGRNMPPACTRQRKQDPDPKIG